MNYANIITPDETAHTYFDHTDDFTLKILAIAADAIVRRQRTAARRARVNWSPAAANELADANYSRLSFLNGMPSDSADRVALRVALIAAADAR